MAPADVLDGQYEMVRMQRKRATTHPGDGGAICEDGASGRATADDAAWHVVDNATDSSNDEGLDDNEDDDDDKKKKRKTVKNAHQKLRVASATARIEPLGFVRRVFRAVVSSQAVVALGIAWCSVVALLLFKWLWFYTGVVKPLEKWLGSKQRPEAEPILVGVVIVAPFVLTGVVFYSFRPASLRLHAPDSWSIVETLRAWRRRAVGGRVDSVDAVVLLVFALVQVNALVGKLLVDQLNGKLAKSGYLNRTGRALGMNGFYAVLISIVLVSRRSFVHEFLQLSSERAAKYHVWCGNFGAISLALHGLIYCYCWIAEGKLAESLIPCFDCETKRAYKSMRNFAGLFAQVMLLAVAFSSLERVRRRHFRRFTLVHCLNVLFVVGTCVHYYPAVFWFVAPMLVYVMYRIVSVFTRARSGIVSARALDDAIVQLQLRRDGVGVGRQDFVPGQYVYLKVDEISKNEWHPFTISSSPFRDQATLSLDVKVQGPFTNRLLHWVRNGSISTVQLDGYYGSGIQTTSDMVFVAGGSGMTPFLSVLEHYVLLSQQEDVIATLPQRMWIVWTARDVSLLNAYMPLLDQVRTSSAWKARVLLHCTSVGDIQDEDALEGVGRFALGNKSVPSHEPGAGSRSPEVSYTIVFAATVVGAVLGMALVFMMASLSSTWWLKRVSLLLAGVLGAMAGASTMLWRALPSRAGFERVDTTDVDMAVTPLKTARRSKESIPSIAISRSRPSIEAILREVHVATNEQGNGDIRVLVSGPSELQERVVAASVPFRSPLMSVECRSFAL